MLIFVWTLSQLLRLGFCSSTILSLLHKPLSASPFTKIINWSPFLLQPTKKKRFRDMFGHSHPLGPKRKSYHHRSNAWGNDLELWTRSSLAARFNMTLWGNFSTNPGMCKHPQKKFPKQKFWSCQKISPKFGTSLRATDSEKKYNLRFPFQPLGFLINIGLLNCYCILHIALIFSWTVECRLKRNQQAPWFLLDEDHFHFLAPCVIWSVLRSACVKSWLQVDWDTWLIYAACSCTFNVKLEFFASQKFQSS